MAKRGRPRTPTAILKLRGSKQLYTRPKNEPVPKEGMPKPPEWLNNEGLKEWNRKVKMLYEQGTLALIDDTVLGAYCDAYADFVYAQQLCQTKDGETMLVIKTTNGNLICSPAYAIKRSARTEMTRLAAEFGMSPSGRSSINIPKRKTQEESKAQKWINKQKGA